jgi:hypothetical protein
MVLVTSYGDGRNLFYGRETQCPRDRPNTVQERLEAAPVNRVDDQASSVRVIFWGSMIA